jgi:hypothetical protein
MLSFRAVIEKFGQMGEKTGWTYVRISPEQATLLKPGCRQSFRIKGKLDELSINALALIPMGDGAFILPLNAEIRKKLKKRQGQYLELNIAEDPAPVEICPDLVACLEDDPQALEFFRNLTGSHQRYFSKWIESAKTNPTREKRIVMAVNALSRGMGYNEMIRANKAEQ